MKRAGPIHAFGRFRLDSGEQLLFCADKAIRLPPKAFDLLKVLVENAGHVIEKDELMSLCWPDAFVEEANIAENIYLVRRALGENRQHHEYIETVHRRGYRFIASVVTQTGVSPVRSATMDTQVRGAVPHFETSVVGTIDERKSCYRGCDEAHHLYQRGRYYWRKYTVDGLNKGIDYFRQAIKIDADYARPYLGVADCYYRLSNVQMHPRKAMAKAKAAAIKAVNLDKMLADGHALLGLIKIFFDRDWTSALREFETAIDLAPESAIVHKRYGWALGLLGSFDQSIVEISRALDLEPDSAEYRVGLGTMFHLARRYEEVIAQAQVALDSLPEFFPAYVLLGGAYVQQGRLTKAIVEFEKAASLASVPWTLGYLGYGYAVSGKRRAALKILTDLENRSRLAYVSPYSLALIYAGLGHGEQALTLLEKTEEDRNEMFGFVRNSPEFDSVRSHNRFALLLNKSRLSSAVQIWSIGCMRESKLN
jgi:DNA-binding winged helix-turn-helix (wHTH) protein/Flp pilus assembly protein TadD